MSVTRISALQARDRLAEGWTYVDVRTVEEFEEGHPEGSINVPLMLAAGGRMAPNPDFTRAMNSVFAKDAKIVVGCRSGGRSARAAQLLEAEGFTSIVDQRAGWDGVRDPFGQVSEPGWSRAGLPVEQGQPSGRSWEDIKKRAG